MTSVDVAVIGRGLIGAAAARHLAEIGFACAVIGPGEPSDRATSDGPFCSHGDEGRVTRIAGRTLLWSKLAARSVARYRDVADRSGIEFHTPAGLVVGTRNLDAWLDSGLSYGSDIRRVDPDWLRSKTGIAIANGLPLAYEGPPAGHINPRRLVAAQTKLARAAGAVVVDDAVLDVERNDGGFEITGQWGAVAAQRVLIATGAFGSHLLDGALALERRPRTIVAAEPVGPVPVPSLILAEPPEALLSEIYWVPPVRFPDGAMRLKIGGTMLTTTVVDDGPELVDHFQGPGDEGEIEALKAALAGLLPMVDFVSFTTHPCVVTTTPSEHPYVGFVDDGVAVALGGNGAAAKSSDEIGRLAASLFTEAGWDDSYDPDAFAPQLA